MRTMSTQSSELNQGNDVLAGMEDSQALDPHSIALFSWWHGGWSVTEFFVPRRSSTELPALFHGVEWDHSSRSLDVFLFPANPNRFDQPQRVHLGMATRIQVSLVSGCHPERVIHFEMQSGEFGLIRMQLDRDRRRSYEKFCEQGAQFSPLSLSAMTTRPPF